MSGYLTAAEIGAEWTRTESWRRYDSAEQLLSLISAYLEKKGLGNSTVSKYEIAEHILGARVKVETPEQAQFAANLREGTTADDAAMRAMDELALAGQVQAWSLAEYSARREQLGVHQSTADFLLGR